MYFLPFPFSLCLTIDLVRCLHVMLTSGGSLDTPTWCMALSAMEEQRCSLEAKPLTHILVNRDYQKPLIISGICGRYCNIWQM